MLAEEVTRFVHGADAALRAQHATEAFFGSRDWAELSAQELDEALHNVPRTGLSRTDLGTEESGLLAVLATSGLYPSRGRARKDVQGGAIAINGRKRSDPAEILAAEDLLADRYVIVRRGKKTYHVLEYS